jgi:dolichol-phosphate mannosyltransferase
MQEGWQVPAFHELVIHPRRHEYALVIPVINEGDRIRAQLIRLKALAFPVDIVIADGGSTDGSLDPDFLRSCAVTVLLSKTGPGRLGAQLRMAYGWCLQQGYAGTVTVDGNGKDGLEAIPQFLGRLQEGYDLVQGSRYLPGGDGINTPLDRKLAGRLIHAPLLSLAGRRWFTDTTNGFRGYSATYLRDPRVSPFRDEFHSYALLFYMTMRAGQLGYRSCEVPVRRAYPAHERTPTKISGFRGRVSMMGELLDVIRGRYNPPEPSPVPPFGRGRSLFDEDTNRWQRRKALLHLIALLVIATATTFHVELTQPVTDPFQEAEYSTFGLLAQTQPGLRMPVLIHGWLDLVPSRIAAVSCPTDRHLVCVRTINTIFQFGSVGLFLAVLITLVGLGTWRALLASLPAVGMLWLYNGSTQRVVDAHQGTPSVRDFLVLAGLLLMARTSRRLDLGETRVSMWPLLLLGGLTMIGLFWVYNRGLALMLVVGLFTITLSVLTRSLKAILAVSIGAAVGLGAAASAGGLQLIRDTLFNIGYWSQNSSIWHTPLQPGTVAPIILIGVLALAGSLQVAWASAQSNRRGYLLFLAVVVAIVALYFVQSLNRPDAAHMRWVVWPVTLLLAMIICSWTAQSRGSGLATLAMALLVCVGYAALLSNPAVLRVVIKGLADNSRALARPAPTDVSLVGPDLARAAELIAARGRCTFAANNVGIVYLLSRMPPCSRFAFGTYVARDRQAEVITELEAGQPDVILWDSPDWYSRIDGLDVHARTPLLARWIEDHYPIKTTIGRQTLLSPMPLQP